MSEQTLSERTAVFLDTCVLLNYLYQEWEGDRAVELLETTELAHVVSESVTEEFETVLGRRAPVYDDFVTFLVESDGEPAEFEPDDRDVWIAGNDQSHVRNIQYVLSRADTAREAQTRLRRVLRLIELRASRLREELLDDVVEQNPELGLQFRVADVVPNSADVKIVCDAAYWCANGRRRGPLVSLDDDDIVRHRDEINETLRTERGEGWCLDIVVPEDVVLTQLREPREEL
jgi:hypothetical protein